MAKINYMRILLIIIYSIVFSVLFLELAFRVIPVNNQAYYRNNVWNHWERETEKEIYNSRYAYNEEIGYEKLSVHRDILQNKDRAGYKILFLGDSVTEWGLYINEFSRLLNYGNLITVNAGTTGYDTELEYRYLKYRGLELAPDMVVLQISMNDYMSTPLIIPQPDGSWIAMDKSKFTKIDPWLMSHSRLYEFFALRTISSGAGKNISSSVKTPLSKIKELLDKEQRELAVVILPNLDNSLPERYDMTKEIVAELGIEAIDLTDYYSNYTYDEIALDPAHPNQMGHMIIGKALYEKINPMIRQS